MSDHEKEAWGLLSADLISRGIDPKKLNRVTEAYERVIWDHDHNEKQAQLILYCMVNYFKVDEAEARKEIQDLRKHDSEFFCHDEAIYTAMHLAGFHSREEQAKLEDKFLNQYIAYRDKR